MTDFDITDALSRAADPDLVGESEYRAVHELLVEAAPESREHAIMMLRAVREAADALEREIVRHAYNGLEPRLALELEVLDERLAQLRPLVEAAPVRLDDDVIREAITLSRGYSDLQAEGVDVTHASEWFVANDIPYRLPDGTFAGR